MWDFTFNDPDGNGQADTYGYGAFIEINNYPNWMSYNKDDFRAAWKQGRFGIMREQNAAYATEANYAPFDKNFPQGTWMVVDARLLNPSA
jgi:hypothetical protein